MDGGDPRTATWPPHIEPTERHSLGRNGDQKMIEQSRLRSIGLRALCLAFLATFIATSSAQSVHRGGALVVADSQATDSLDPHFASSRSNVWMSMLYDTLLGYHYDGTSGEFEIVPALAVSYEVVNPTTLDFALREGVEFHDHTPWNADAAKWNFDRAMNDPRSVVGVSFTGIESVEAVEPYLLRLHLKSPQPLLPLQLTPANNVGLWFVSPTAVEKLGDEEFGRNPVGTGPFQFVSWIPDDRLDLVRFDGHWELGDDGLPLPYVDSFATRFITDGSVASLGLRSGDINVYFNVGLSALAALDRDSATKTGTQPGRYTGTPSFYFNPRPDYPSPFSQDVRLRLAVQHAIDRESMALALGFGTGEPHYVFSFYPGVPGYDPNLVYEYDPELAKSLLAEAGYPNGIELEVKVINRPDDVRPLEVMQAMLSEVGITLNIRMMDRLEWIADGNSGNFEALSHGNSSQPSALLRMETQSDSQYNWAGYSNPKVDELWAEASSEYDEAARNEIFRAIQRIVFDDAFHLIGYRYPSTVALKKNVEGVSTMYNLRYAWLD